MSSDQKEAKENLALTAGLQMPKANHKQFVLKCQISEDELIILASSEDYAFRKAQTHGWTRSPNEESDPDDDRYLKYNYYAPGFGKTMNVIITDTIDD